MLKQRLREAGRFSLKHLAVSMLIALLCAFLVFFVWYPYPYNELAGGRGLFILLVSVDVVIGPMLSLVVYNSAKPRRELWRDLGVIFFLQLSALVYGMHSVAQARPVWLAFEGDRYRIVAIPDIEEKGLKDGELTSARLSWTGPKPVGVKMLSNTDPEFPRSIQLAMQGIHPAFRPERWVDYETQIQQAIRQARPLAELKSKHPTQIAMIEEALRHAGVAESELGFMPLASEHRTDWSVVISLKDGAPRFYLPLDAW